MTEEPDHKEIVKQAIKEWMNERYAEVGYYTIKVLLTATISIILFKYIELRGYKLP